MRFDFTSFFLSLIILGGMTEVYWGSFSSVYKSLFCDFDSVALGVVVTSEKRRVLVNGGDRPRYGVDYEYVVGGEYYRSNLVNFALKNEELDRILREYPAGKKVSVNYDMKRPYCAVLELGSLSFKLLASVAVVFLLSACFSFRVA